MQMMTECRPIIKRGKLKIDTQRFKVILNNDEVCLSSKEFKILLLMAEHPEWVFTKEQLYETVYGKEDAINIDNVIYCIIYNLRKKIESSSRSIKLIQTIRGVGYKFVIPEE